MKAVKLEELKPFRTYVIKLPIGKLKGTYLCRNKSGSAILFIPECLADDHPGCRTIELPVEAIVYITEGKPVLPRWPEA